MVTLIKENEILDKNEVSINSTHLCVLRYNEDSHLIEYGYLPVDYAFPGLLEKLNNIALQDNTNVLDLQKQVEAQDIDGVLYRCYDYCTHLERANDNGFACIQPFTTESYEEAMQNLTNFYNKNYSIRKNVSLSEYLLNHEKQIMSNFIKNIEDHIKGFSVNCAYDKCKGDNTIKAYSNCKVGWTTFDFNLNTSLDICFKSNFGYGRSAYFYEILKYKGIKILPYSDWVTYHYAGFYELINYTRSFRLETSSWKNAMSFTTEIFNDMIQNPSDFVNKWIVSEVEKMVVGLKSYLDSNHVYHLNTSSGDKVELTDESEIMRFKSEKISGALGFVESIKTLEELEVDVNKYITIIIDCCRNLYPLLDKYISSKEEECRKLKEIIEKDQKEYISNMCNSIDYNYEQKFDALAKRFSSLYHISVYKAFKIIEGKLIYKVIEKKFNCESSFNDNIFDCLQTGKTSYIDFLSHSEEYAKLQKYLTEMHHYHDRISSYFSKNDLVLENAG